MKFQLTVRKKISSPIVFRVGAAREALELIIETVPIDHAKRYSVEYFTIMMRLAVSAAFAVFLATAFFALSANAQTYVASSSWSAAGCTGSRGDVFAYPSNVCEAVSFKFSCNTTHAAYYACESNGVFCDCALSAGA